MRDGLVRFYDVVMQVGERRPSAGVGLVYVVAETDVNRWDSLRTLEDRLRAGGIDGKVPLGVCGRARSPGYSGIESWLKAMGATEHTSMADHEVLAVGSSETKPLNTLTEMEALVRHCIRHSVRRVALLAPRWHLPRCVLSFLGEASRQRADTAVVPWVADTSDWDEVVEHSQGELRAKRCDLLLHETLRIIEYAAKRDLPDPGDAVELLRHLL